ncbi:MAG: hypothetical protein ACRC4G_06720 [Alphaproteobacteria bacterium]
MKSIATHLFLVISLTSAFAAPSFEETAKTIEDTTHNILSKAVEANGITENMTLDVAYVTNLFSKDLRIDMTDFVKSAENLTQHKWHMDFPETEAHFFSPSKHALLINYLIGMQTLRWKQDETSKTFLFKLDQNAPSNIIFILKTLEYFPKNVSELPAFGQNWFENLEAPEWIKLALPKCEVTSTLDVKMLAKKLDIPFQEVDSVVKRH